MKSFLRLNSTIKSLALLNACGKTEIEHEYVYENAKVEFPREYMPIDSHVLGFGPWSLIAPLLPKTW
jgi:hypothetical protein